MDPSKGVPTKEQTAAEPSGPHAVRFSSKNQEIEPEHSLHTIATLTSENSRSEDALSPEAKEELRNLSRTLQESQLQHGRMSHFAFEPVSLPVSRAPSNESSPRRQLADGRKPSVPSPRDSTSFPVMHNLPLTPAVSTSHDEQPGVSTTAGDHAAQPHMGVTQMTPQTSGPSKTPPPTSADGILYSRRTPSLANSRPSSSSGQTSTQPSTFSSNSGTVEALPKRTPLFIPGPTGDSLPPSRDPSPSRTPGHGSGTATPTTAYSRPFTPSGDHDDPYARSKRQPQSRNLDAIDARFIFGGKDSRRLSTLSAGAVNLNTGPLPRSNSGNDLKTSQEKHKSMFSLQPHAGNKDHHGHLRDDNTGGVGKSHGSMSDLKRFLRLGHSHKDKRAQSPSPSIKSPLNKSGTRTPPRQIPASSVPFADDHGLESKYGKFGKVLGSGAGGSVRLLKRSGDGVTFAVKQFRERHSYETERDYNKKVTAEFCIGSTLHHGNIIETLDIIQERGHWYEVMEYAPFDLFAMVMTGKMSREEVACSFLQIFAGVTYLHSMGLAHRDLKLDNVVVNEFGIMKLIDFGSACVFRYPFENDIVLASGVVGSDPYLAPEVYDNSKYDPQPADIWSLAIIFACMSLRRFPWKAPRVSDNSYKLFISPPSPGTPSEVGPRRTSEQRPKSMMDLSVAADGARRKSAPQSEEDPRPKPDDASSKHSHHHNQHQSEVSLPETNGATTPEPLSASKQEVIKGPWRLLRLLPRESRNIIGRMLETNPRRRATIEEMLADPWVSGTPVCAQVEDGKVIKAPGHEHTLEPSSPDPPAPAKR